MGRDNVPGWLQGCYWIFCILLCFVAPIYASTVKPERAVMTMERAGYSNIQVGQRVEWFVTLRGCAYDDAVMFKIDSATDMNGIEVTNAVVCKGLFDGSIVRYR